MYSSAQATSFVSQTASDSSFLPTMAKRTASQASEAIVKEFVVTPIDAFDINLFAVKERGVKKDGTPVFVTSYNQQRLTLNLAPGKKQWLQVKYKIQASMYDKEDATNLKVTLAVDEAVAETITRIEDVIKKVVTEKLKKTFGEDDHRWHTAVKENLFTSKAALDAKKEGSLTQFKVRPFKKDVVNAAGKEQLQPLLDQRSGFLGAKAKATVSPYSVWILKKGGEPATAGILWKIHNATVDLPEQVRWVAPDVFADASWDDSDNE